MTSEPAGPDTLTRRERAGLIALAVLILVFGAITLNRSAFLQGRHTDADVYFRAAWAIQSGANLYKITDTNDWHYHYPPLLAILLTPFADPPPDAPEGSRGWGLPYPVSVAVWYLLSVLILFWAVHMLAGAVEATSPLADFRNPLRFGRRWWRLRIVPILVCLPMIGYTLGRGQVNFLLLLSLCGMCASMLKGRDFRAGMWLAFGVCIKAYLLALLIYPLLRGNRRCIAGFAAGMFIGLVLVPLAALGPERTAEVYGDLYELRLKGMATGRLHPDIAEELDVLRGQFPTYGATLYKAVNPDPREWPASLPPAYSAFQFALGAGLAALTLLAAGVRTKRERQGTPRLLEILAPGALVLVLLPAVSTCKPHYYTLAILPVLGLVAAIWERRGQPRIGPTWTVFFAVFCAANFLSEIPRVMFLTAGGAAPIAAILLWLACIFRVLRLRRAGERLPGTSPDSTTRESA